MKIDKKKCLKLVIEQIENMLYSNKENIESIEENFNDWCENGNVFYYLTDKELSADKRINEKEKDFCIKYMNEIAPVVDTLTDKLLYTYSKIEEI